ncbi:MAG: glycerol-3-phosphate acyltransferase [Oscillospiraceae bacterium]|jgi:glycerol-3-phosphate acyltransferase PlsY|nr:glycerol-3-phosphate acyltransferase [Oscillospiraceae bacterium]
MIAVLFIVAIVAYLLGGINGAIIASKYIFKKDIRNYGSGNAGLTNFYRIFGAKGVALVLLIDIGKTVIGILFGWLMLRIYGFSMVGKLFAGFFLTLGHVFPVYYGFKGGKGVLCCGITVLAVDPVVGLICWIVFAIVALLTHYISLGSIAAAVAFPIGIAAFGGWWLQVLLAIFCAVVLIIMHRHNIIRLILGKESKFSFEDRKKARTESK